MYREPSPVFDLHEFPTLRRVKPLPRRRRRSTSTGNASSAPVVQQPGSGESTEQVYSAQIPLELLDEPLNSSITTEQFIANAEFLTRKISQSIYMNHLPDIAQNILDSLGKAGVAPSFASAAAGSSPLETATSSIVDEPSNDPREPRPTHEELSNAIQADIDLISEAAMQARALPAELLRNITEKLAMPNFPGVPSTLNPPSGNVDLDAIFAAGYEAGLSGAGLNGGQYRNGVPQSRQAPFYRPQYHQSNEASSQGATYVEGTVGEEGFADGATTAPVTPSMQSRQVLHGEISVDVRRRTGREEEEEDDDYGEDRQPGPNYSKKRKVPANAGMSHLRGEGRGDEVEGEDSVGDPYTAQRVGLDGGYDEDGGGGTVGASGVGHQDSAVEGEVQDLGLDSTGARLGIQPTFSAPQLASPRTARMPLSALSTLTMSAPTAARVGQLSNIRKARGRLTAAMVAGVQHKENLKTRKRQLAAVMGALTQGDSVALDQALSMAGSAYPFGGPLGMPPSALFAKEPTPNLGGGKENVEEDKGSQIKTRASKRPSARLARVARSTPPAPPPQGETILPTSGFAFTCPSLTAERLMATKEEVATLRNRFEAELERQAMNAAKLAAASKMPPPPEGYALVPNTAPTKSKKRDKAKGKVGSAGKPGTTQQQQQYPPGTPQQPAVARNAPPAKGQGQPPGATPQQGQAADASQQLPPSSKPKKKKRSALANASNPHHLRNYVPSRLPQSAGGHNPNASTTPQTLLGPPPLRFLSADLPPPRGSKSKKGSNVNGSVTASASVGSITGGAGDEWICLFCEYDLFYGDDALFRRGVKNRKKVLKRRRRARERAAAAASGVKTGLKAATGGAAARANSPTGQPAGNPSAGGDEDEYDGDPGYEGGGGGTDEYGNVPRHEVGGGGGYHHGYVEGQAVPVG
ncbi:hypothetical protein BKA70DRAFT_883895 [Coprinopsis sp. MPI-PUGE-AT-0042]|nr:hypothetical protein BKA70DRAFT_883895 [Coprinopsis sp. MPI-PUGE-AT-0042]